MVVSGNGCHLVMIVTGNGCHMVVVVIGNGCTGSGCHLTSWVYGDESCKMDTFASMKHIVMVALNVVFLLSTRITFLNEKRNSRC